MITELPKEKTKKKERIQDFTIFIHGPPKIGKSTFASQFPGALFLASEVGYKSLEVFAQNIEKWEDIFDVGTLLFEKSHDYETLIWDTIDIHYKLCEDYVLAQLGLAMMPDDFGRTREKVNSEFLRVTNKFSLAGFGMVYISHSKEKEIKGRVMKINKTVPTIMEGGRKVTISMSDIIIYCGFDTVKDAEGNWVEKRIANVEPSETLEAGDRTNRLPHKFELSYDVFKTYFKE